MPADSQPPLGEVRREIEGLWRERLEAAYARYIKVTEEFRNLIEEPTTGETSRPAVNDALAQARRRQAESLLEFRRVLQIFADLTVYGKRPPEDPESSVA